MDVKRSLTMFSPISLLAAAVAFSASAQAATAETYCEYDQPVLIRRTLPLSAARRSPLTTDQFSTPSTRAIDARRGFRPFVAVVPYGQGYGYRVPAVGYDDRFGITRPETRPISYALRTPRTGVKQFTNRAEDMQTAPAADTTRQAQSVIVIRDERQPANTPPSQKTAPSKPAPDMKVRIHSDASAIPTTTGAVIVCSDGTVIQVGD